MKYNSSKIISINFIFILFISYDVFSFSEVKNPIGAKAPPPREINNPELSFQKSFNEYNNVYTGKFKFISVEDSLGFGSIPPAEGKHVSVVFEIDSRLKGKDRKSVQLSWLASYACIKQGERAAFLRKEGGIPHGLRMQNYALHEEHIKKLVKNSNGDDCYAVFYSRQGFATELYKSRPEYIFENEKYVLFASDLVISKGKNQTSKMDVDIAVFDKEIVLRTTKRQ